MADVEVRGRYLLGDDSPAQGDVTFAPRVAAANDSGDGNILIGRRVRVTLDDAGEFTVTLQASDDPVLDPTGWTYQVVEELSGIAGRWYDIEIPTSAVAAGIDLWAVAPAPPSAGDPTAFVTLTAFAAMDARVDALEAWAGSDVDSVDGRSGAVTLADLYQPLDSDLTAIAALSTTAFGRDLLALSTAAAARTALGLGTASTQPTGAFDPAGSAAAAVAVSRAAETRQVVAYLGDSQGPATTYVYGATPTWAGVARSILGHRYADGVSAGIGGQTSTQVAARVATITATAPSICFVFAGINDIAAGTASATVIANLQTIIDALLAAGVKPILMTLLPSTSVNTPVKLGAATRVNDWIKALPVTQGVLSVDVRAAVADYTSTTGGWVPAWTIDGVHANDLGHTVMGKVVADALAPLIRGPGPLLSDAGSDGSLLSLNPGMTGSGGTAGAGVTGTIPASWTLNPNGSVAAVSSVEARTDGVGGNWLKIDISAGSLLLFQQNTAAGSAWNVGDTTWFEAEVLISSTPTNLRGLQASLQFWNAVGAVNDYTLMQANTVTSPIRGDSRPYVLRTTPTVVPVGTGRLQAFLYVNQSVASMAATVRIGRCAIRRAI